LICLKDVAVAGTALNCSEKRSEVKHRSTSAGFGTKKLSEVKHRSTSAASAAENDFHLAERAIIAYRAP
jgi:hypothetical protein